MHVFYEYSMYSLVFHVAREHSASHTHTFTRDTTAHTVARAPATAFRIILEHYQDRLRLRRDNMAYESKKAIRAIRPVEQRQQTKFAVCC